MLFTDAPIDAPWDVIVQSYMDVMGWSREHAEEYVDVLAGIGMWEPCDRKEKIKMPLRRLPVAHSGKPEKRTNADLQTEG